MSQHSDEFYDLKIIIIKRDVSAKDKQIKIKIQSVNYAN